MRTIWLLLIACLLGCHAEPADDAPDQVNRSVDEIVAACAEALGGMEKVEALRTFRTVTSWDGEEPVTTDIRRPNLMRTTGRSTLVFDGARAALLEGPADGEGPRGPTLLDPAVWKDFEIDLAFRFPAFFDFPTEYAGVESVMGREAFRLRVTLPLGTLVTYFIDTETALPLKAVSAVRIEGKEYAPELTYGEFVEAGGLLFPSRFRQGWTPETAENAVVDRVEVNVPFADDHFRIPADIAEVP